MIETWKDDNLALISAQKKNDMMEMLRNADENSDILQPHIFYKKLSSIFPG
jgi:hypothetical protein